LEFGPAPIFIRKLSSPYLGGPLPKRLAQELREAAPQTPIFLLTEKYNLAIEKTPLACGVTAVFSKLDDLEALVSNARAIARE
jgi:hypothetical protein